MNPEMLRDREGHAKQYATPERAEVDAERLRTKQPELCVWIRWLPVPLRPWRVCFEVASSTLAAVRTLETAADSLMRLGDPGNAIALYALALRLRSEYLREETQDAVT